MKNYLLLSILCLAGILMSCTQKHTRYRIGVSQCSDDEWRHKMNNEIVREALFYDGVEVEIRTAKDNNRNQIADIKYFIDKKVDLLIVAPNEAAAITPVVEKAYRQGIPVVVIDRKILSDKYTAFVGLPARRGAHPRPVLRPAGQRHAVHHQPDRERLCRREERRVVRPRGKRPL